MPVSIERLTPLNGLELPEISNEYIFDTEDLRRLCGGATISEGFFALPRAHNIRAYKLLNSTYDPLLPPHPGAHGAQISCYGKGRDVSA
jgi:hypothetical protein